MSGAQDPFDFGDWESETEDHEHCVLTENLCRNLATQYHGHGAQCCTCDEMDMSHWLQYGCSTPDELLDRLQAIADELNAEAPGPDLEARRELEQGLIKSIDAVTSPKARKAFLERLGNPELVFPSQRYTSVYAEIAARAAADTRVISTASSPKHGRIIVAHKFLPLSDDNTVCKRCGTPRENRLHRMNELPENNILKALKDAVSHQCEFDCGIAQCNFDYRKAVRQVRRILKEI